MTETVLESPPIPAEATARGHTTQKQTSKGTRLRQAGIIAGMCEKALSQMSVSLSFDDSENARVNAQALASVARAWQAAVEEMRIARGEPLPGSRKPAPDMPKRTQRGPRNKPPSPPVPVSEAPKPIQ